MLIENRKEVSSYEEDIKKSIKWLNNHGFEEIKADIEDYETPVQFLRRDDNQPFMPDITAQRYGRKYYFDIARKTGPKKKRQLVAKWKLLSSLSERKKSDFYLFVPYGSVKFTNELLDKHNIKAEVVRI